MRALLAMHTQERLAGRHVLHVAGRLHAPDLLRALPLRLGRGHGLGHRVRRLVPERLALRQVLGARVHLEALLLLPHVENAAAAVGQGPLPRARARGARVLGEAPLRVALSQLSAGGLRSGVHTVFIHRLGVELPLLRAHGSPALHPDTNLLARSRRVCWSREDALVRGPDVGLDGHI